MQSFFDPDPDPDPDFDFDFDLDLDLLSPHAKLRTLSS